MEEREEPSCQPPERTAASTRLNRRDWLKATVGGGAGLALEGLPDVRAVRAASREFKFQKAARLLGLAYVEHQARL
jgi:hypothetical protein